ncbi:MAG: chloramphenicol acetyltransferase [Alphaproteobacteria bacterium PA4]|nr:MAG: chloramphenicol acetyltransferase [Alphaproteobacteria bacterium PA4]
MAMIGNLIDRLSVRLAPGGQYESRWLRRRFLARHDLDIGLYSFGAFDRWRMPPGTRIGRYCSIASSARVIEANHPITALSSHPILYDGAIPGGPRIPANRQEIGDDVWLGHNAVILPGCQRIGRGAIIGAGAIVTADVPPYAVMAGVPARPLRLRFAADVIAAIEATRWWLLDAATLRRGLAAAPDFATAPSRDGAARFYRAVHGLALPDA